MKKQTKKENGIKNHAMTHHKASFRSLPGDRDPGRLHIRHEILKHKSIRAFIEGFLC